MTDGTVPLTQTSINHRVNLMPLVVVMPTYNTTASLGFMRFRSLHLDVFRSYRGLLGSYPTISKKTNQYITNHPTTKHNNITHNPPPPHTNQKQTNPTITPPYIQNHTNTPTLSKPQNTPPNPPTIHPWDIQPPPHGISQTLLNLQHHYLPPTQSPFISHNHILSFYTSSRTSNSSINFEISLLHLPINIPLNNTSHPPLISTIHLITPPHQPVIITVNTPTLHTTHSNYTHNPTPLTTTPPTPTRWGRTPHQHPTHPHPPTPTQPPPHNTRPTRRPRPAT